jgi:hypothetical protein
MSLRDLLIEAIRYGEKPEVKAYLTTVLDTALDRATFRTCSKSAQLAHDAMDASKVQRIREDMERADARRLQPHYIESFFHEAFKRLGGTSSNARRAATRSPTCPPRCATAIASSASASRCCRGMSASPSRRPWSHRRASRWPPLSAPAIRCSMPSST